MAWFRRKDAESMDPQVLLQQGHESTAVSAAGGFRLAIQDVFAIAGRGTVVVGRVDAGTVTTGATVRIVRADGTVREVQVAGIEAFRKRLDAASAGDNIGLLFRDVTKSDVAAGDIVSS